MKFNKLLFWLGLRPLTADILYDEYLRTLKKRVQNVFEDTIVPELIRCGRYSRLVLDNEEAKVLEGILTKAKIGYQTREDSYGTFFNISIKE